MVEPKGILAADESTRSMNKRLAQIGAAETEEAGRQFRELMFTAPGVGEYLTSVILYDATIRQNDSSGKPLAHVLESQGIIPGIKVDTGLIPLPGFPGEEVSTGLDGLSVRLREYYELGARFTKWRSVITIDEEHDLPTEQAVAANVHVLARYAMAVQEANMVPMVEPEVLYSGTHTLERSAEIIRATLDLLFNELSYYGVAQDGLILKTSMALPGKESGIGLVPMDVARETVNVLRDVVPPDVAGIVFLSGGQTPDESTANLRAICQLGEHPWPMTFSFSRAIEEPVLEAWRGLPANVPEAQRVFIKRLQLNCAARAGS